MCFCSVYDHIRANKSIFILSYGVNC